MLNQLRHWKEQLFWFRVSHRSGECILWFPSGIQSTFSLQCSRSSTHCFRGATWESGTGWIYRCSQKPRPICLTCLSWCLSNSWREFRSSIYSCSTAILLRTSDATITLFGYCLLLPAHPPPHSPAWLFGLSYVWVRRWLQNSSLPCLAASFFFQNSPSPQKYLLPQWIWKRSLLEFTVASRLFFSVNLCMKVVFGETISCHFGRPLWVRGCLCPRFIRCKGNANPEFGGYKSSFLSSATLIGIHEQSLPKGCSFPPSIQSSPPLK